MHEAQCSCGGLRVKAVADPKVVIMCHCTECQRRTGAPFGSTIYQRSSDAERAITGHFCPTCGTTVHWRAEFVPDFIGVAVGCFSEPDFPAPQRAVHVRRKHAWVTIPDGIPAIETQGS